MRPGGRETFSNFLRQPGADRAEVMQACVAVGLEPREDYVQALAHTNGGEGFIGQSYLRLYSTDELVALNQAYQVKRFAPGLVVFGSNGAGEAYGFDTRRKPIEIVQIPFIPLDIEQAIQFGDSFEGFLERLGKIVRGLGPGIPTLNPAAVGKEVHERQPIAHGGSPMDPANKVLVPPAQHAELCVFWNEVYWSKGKGS